MRLLNPKLNFNAEEYKHDFKGCYSEILAHQLQCDVTTTGNDVWNLVKQAGHSEVTVTMERNESIKG